MIPYERVLIFFSSILFVIVYAKILFRGTAVAALSGWNRTFLLALFLNILLYSALVYYFNYKYGWIVDDVIYYYRAEDFPYTSIFKLKSGNEFMYFIVKPIRALINPDLLSFHIIFGAIGFVGSLNFVFIILQRIDVLEEWTFGRLAIFLMLCFPNFIAWGRFFGKDAIMLFLGSIMTIACFRIIEGSKTKIIDFCIVVVMLYLMQILRPHISGVLSLSVIGAYGFRIWKARYGGSNIALGGLVRIFVPVLLLLLAILISLAITRKMSVKSGSLEDSSVSAVKAALISASMQGAVSESVTSLASEMADNPEILFSPRRVIQNILYLLFAPFPWAIRGVADIIALLSNVLLAIILAKYWKQVHIFDSFQYFLLFASIGLLVLLSFMTANVGLILRQKTILLPFVFLLIFSREKVAHPSGYTNA